MLHGAFTGPSGDPSAPPPAGGVFDPGAIGGPDGEAGAGAGVAFFVSGVHGAGTGGTLPGWPGPGTPGMIPAGMPRPGAGTGVVPGAGAWPPPDTTCAAIPGVDVRGGDAGVAGAGVVVTGGGEAAPVCTGCLSSVTSDLLISFVPGGVRLT